MSNEIKLIDAPSVIGVKQYQVETLEGAIGFRTFTNFHWHGEDYWNLGKALWRGIYFGGFGNFIVSPQTKTTTLRFLIRKSRDNALRYNLQYPHQAGAIARDVVFLGFSSQTLVDIDFVRYEHERLKNAPPNYAKLLDKKVRKRKKWKLI